MCGIAGIIERAGKAPSREEALRLGVCLRRRGPDAMGAVQAGRAALAHARLSVIDLEGGAQPMESADGRFIVTFNGEIFNYRELRTRLRALGHCFRTRSDTEVLLAAYHQWGPKCVDHFNGQWALGIWDRHGETLFLSRDRLGIRPLYYTFAENRFLFASEVKALFADPGVTREIDPVGLEQVFTFWTSLAPRTVFAGIRELPAGCSLTLRDGRVAVERYWRVDYSHPDRAAGVEENAEALLDLLLDATRLRLRADVPVGLYVSGGLDSSINAALVRELADGPLGAFSIEFEDGEFDEGPFQHELAEFLGLDRSVTRCEGGQIADIFPETVRHAERPILRTAAAPMQLLSRLARESGFKVVLTGEGADEIFGGYDVFKEAKARVFWSANRASPLRRKVFSRLYPYMPRIQAQSPEYLAAFFRAGAEDVANPYFSHLPRWELTSRLKAFFSEDLKSRLVGEDPYAELRAALPVDFAKWDFFERAEYLETTVLLPGYILGSQGDRAAMANGVEGRYPMLDHRVVEFAARLPSRLKMRGLKEKWLLKKAVGRLVPESILKRPKQPYRAPDAKCFVEGSAGKGRLKEFVEALLQPPAIEEWGLFDSGAVAALSRKVLAGRALGVKDNMAFVGILSTQILAEEFLDSPPRRVEREEMVVAPETISAAVTEMFLESVE